MATAYLTHPDFMLHENPDDHPESPVRLKAIKAELKFTGLWEQLLHPEVQSRFHIQPALVPTSTPGYRHQLSA